MLCLIYWCLLAINKWTRRRESITSHSGKHLWTPLRIMRCSSRSTLCRSMWVNVHNESLVFLLTLVQQYRDIAAVTGIYPAKPNLVPCSDVAGEVVAVGTGVTSWRQGDRVVASFAINYLSGEITQDLMNATLGGPIDGVLTQYKNLPASVRFPSLSLYWMYSDANCSRPFWRCPSTWHTKRLPPWRRRSSSFFYTIFKLTTQ